MLPACRPFGTGVGVSVALHHGEVILAGEINRFPGQCHWLAGVKAEVLNLQQQVTRVAAPKRTFRRDIVTLYQIVDCPIVVVDVKLGTHDLE